MQNYDVVIIGAGPAGSTAALSLKKSGLKVVLCEKAAFPREKICGDGLCDRSINTLKAISKLYFKELFAEINPLKIQKAALVYKNRYHTLNFNNYGFTVPRIEFDEFLVSRVKRDCSNVEVIENTKIINISRSGEFIEVMAKEKVMKAKFLIFADGAHSKLADVFTGNKRMKAENGLAVRAYFRGIQHLEEDCIEMHLKKTYLPGYFWIFPLRNGLANVGFGYHLKYAHKNSSSIKNIFRQWVNSDLKERFSKAEQVSSLKGGLVPFSNNSYKNHGDNYVIAGDSAGLVDPLSGGGIGNAMFSGREAALQAMRCFENNDFSATQTKNYSYALKKRMQQETTKRKHLKNAISKHSWLLDVLAIFSRSNKLRQKITNWYIN